VRHRLATLLAHRRDQQHVWRLTIEIEVIADVLFEA